MTTDNVLGIDIGTTSIKAVLIGANQSESDVICRSVATEARIDVPGHPDYDEQDVNKIITSITEVVEGIQKEAGLQRMSHVSKIAICGQMHGCLFWKKSHIIQASETELTSVDSHNISNLITWQDGRCSAEFLNSLPLSEASALPLSTGYGCATILWLSRYKSKFLEQYDCCGTIADYMVARLACLTTPAMSTQNAVSWGYFNSWTNNWDDEVLNAVEFPKHFLPSVVAPCTKVGKIRCHFCGISDHAEIVVGMGDMQCSVMSCRIAPNEAVLNLSTSAQLSMLAERTNQSNVTEGPGRRPKPVIRVPYFGRYDLLTSASLNGGAVFASFVEMLTKWTREFSPDVTNDDVYRLLTDENSLASTRDTSLKCSPLLFGERHDPHATVAIENIRPIDCTFPAIARSLARGILENLRCMFESDVTCHSISHLWACGGAFAKNSLFREELENHVFKHVTVSFDRNADAAYGAALAVLREEFWTT